MIVGFIALLTGKTGDIITIACFGALSLYIISMIAFFALRQKEPQLERPFKVPLYPLFPATALVIASVAFIAMAYYNLTTFSIYCAILLAAALWFKLLVKVNA